MSVKDYIVHYFSGPLIIIPGCPWPSIALKVQNHDLKQQLFHFRAINFGAIGMVMGHELTHGFDNMGRLYDKHGNLDNWWGNASAKHFEEKTECLVNQYNQYKVGDDHVSTVGKCT